MIKVRCLASGSSGNSYAVDDGKSVLLLEAGVKAKRIVAGFSPVLSRVAGCLISHEHGDHACGAGELAGYGVDLYASEGTLEAIRSSIRHPYRCNVIRVGEQVQLGSWVVLPFETKHDAAEPMGFLLYSTAAREKLLFATDTYYIPNRFCGLNVIMVECNYSPELLRENIAKGLVPESQRPRLLQSHFGLQNVKDFLLANDLSQTRRIYLIHVSSRNGDKSLFEKEIRQLTGIPVTVF